MRILSPACSAELLRYSYKFLAFFAIIHQLLTTICAEFLLQVICSTWAPNHSLQPHYQYLLAVFKSSYMSQLMLRFNGEIINSNCSEKSSRSYPCVPPSCAKRSNQQSRTSFFLASQYSFASPYSFSFLAAPDLPLHSGHKHLPMYCTYRV